MREFSHKVPVILSNWSARMASSKLQDISRRSFLSATGCGAGFAVCASSALSQDPLAKSFLPCTLHPLRVNTIAPPSHQERALELQGNRSPSAPQMPQAHRTAAAAPAFLKGAPARDLARPTGKAQMAAVDRWRKSELTIAFFDGQPTSFLDRVLALAQQWAELTKLTFKVINNPGAADIRVGFNLGSGQDG